MKIKQKILELCLVIVVSTIGILAGASTVSNYLFLDYYYTDDTVNIHNASIEQKKEVKETKCTNSVIARNKASSRKSDISTNTDNSKNNNQDIKLKKQKAEIIVYGVKHVSLDYQLKDSASIANLAQKSDIILLETGNYFSKLQNDNQHPELSFRYIDAVKFRSNLCIAQAYFALIVPLLLFMIGLVRNKMKLIYISFICFILSNNISYDWCFDYILNGRNAIMFEKIESNIQQNPDKNILIVVGDYHAQYISEELKDRSLYRKYKDKLLASVYPN